MIRVGVVGAGAAALTAHLPAIGASDRFRLVGICDTNPERLAAAAGRFAVLGSADLRSLLDEPGLDALVVATPPQSHRVVAADAIGVGKHVLCEKPLARAVEECRSLVALASSQGVVLAVGHEKRFHPTLQRIRELIHDGAIGQPFYGGVHWAASAKLDPDRLIPAGFRDGYEWRWRDPSVGGGLLQDHLPHYLDLFRFWIEDEPTEVQAHIANVARDYLAWPGEESVWEDFALVIVRFAHGFALRFETSVVGRSISPIWSLGAGMGEWTEYGYLLGSAGQLVFDLLPWDSSEHGRIALNRVGGEGWISLEQPEPQRRFGGAAHAMFSGQLEAFADAVEGRGGHIARGEDGVVCAKVVEAAYEAAKRRTTVTLP